MKKQVINKVPKILRVVLLMLVFVGAGRACWGAMGITMPSKENPAGNASTEVKAAYTAVNTLLDAVNSNAANVDDSLKAAQIAQAGIKGHGKKAAQQYAKSVIDAAQDYLLAKAAAAAAALAPPPPPLAPPPPPPLAPAPTGRPTLKKDLSALLLPTVKAGDILAAVTTAVQEALDAKNAVAAADLAAAEKKVTDDDVAALKAAEKPLDATWQANYTIPTFTVTTATDEAGIRRNYDEFLTDRLEALKTTWSGEKATLEGEKTTLEGHYTSLHATIIGHQKNIAKFEAQANALQAQLTALDSKDTEIDTAYTKNGSTQAAFNGVDQTKFADDIQALRDYLTNVVIPQLPGGGGGGGGPVTPVPDVVAARAALKLKIEGYSTTLADLQTNRIDKAADLAAQAKCYVALVQQLATMMKGIQIDALPIIAAKGAGKWPAEKKWAEDNIALRQTIQKIAEEKQKLTDAKNAINGAVGKDGTLLDVQNKLTTAQAALTGVTYPTGYTDIYALHGAIHERGLKIAFLTQKISAIDLEITRLEGERDTKAAAKKPAPAKPPQAPVLDQAVLSSLQKNADKEIKKYSKEVLATMRSQIEASTLSNADKVKIIGKIDAKLKSGNA